MNENPREPKTQLRAYPTLPEPIGRNLQSRIEALDLATALDRGIEALEGGPRRAVRDPLAAPRRA